MSDLWESKVSLDELQRVVSLNLVVGDDGGLDDVDGLTSGTVSTGQFIEQLSDGVADGVGSVFLVHVDHASSGLVLEHDTIVLD